MPKTFEERVATELDSLYQGALFLAGGNAHGAERLIVESVSAAFTEHAYQPSVGSFERWLEERMVRAFLRGVGERRAKDEPLSGGPPPSDFDEEALRAVPAGRFFDAAGAVPAWPRAALWLVLLRRWSYGEAAEALGVEREVLVDLLRYRHVLLKAMMGRGNGSRGFGS